MAKSSRIATICPNPKCQKRIEEPVLMNNLSAAPAEQYYACPRCLIKVKANVTSTNLVGISFISFGSVILALVGCLTLYDMTIWGKNIALIFFSSRTDEAISLGIGMKVIYYSLIGLALTISGSCIFLGRRSNAMQSQPSATAREKEKDPSKCPYYFGYLKKFDQNTPIPDECLGCSRMLECFGYIEHSFCAQ